MRTVILLGLIIIANAIGTETPYTDEVVGFMAVVLIVAMVMDVFEFFTEVTK